MMLCDRTPNSTKCSSSLLKVPGCTYVYRLGIKRSYESNNDPQSPTPSCKKLSVYEKLGILQLRGLNSRQLGIHFLSGQVRQMQAFPASTVNLALLTFLFLSLRKTIRILFSKCHFFAKMRTILVRRPSFGLVDLL